MKEKKKRILTDALSNSVTCYSLLLFLRPKLYALSVFLQLKRGRRCAFVDNSCLHVWGVINYSKLYFTLIITHDNYSTRSIRYTDLLCWTGLTLLNGFSFLVNIFLSFFNLGRAVDLAGLTASFRVHVNIIISLLTYLLTYLLSHRLVSNIPVFYS